MSSLGWTYAVYSGALKRPADKSKPVTTGQTSRYHPIENAIYEAAEGRRAGYSTPCFLAGKAVDKQAEGK